MGHDARRTRSPPEDPRRDHPAVPEGPPVDQVRGAGRHRRGDPAAPRAGPDDASATSGPTRTAATSRRAAPLLASMLDGTMLTDDYYVDAQRDPVQRTLALHPRRRRLTARRDADGDRRARSSGSSTRNGGSAAAARIVTGQDFMTDGAERVQSILRPPASAPVREPSPTVEQERVLRATWRSEAATWATSTPTSCTTAASPATATTIDARAPASTGPPSSSPATEIGDATQLRRQARLHHGLPRRPQRARRSSRPAGRRDRQAPDPRLDVAQAMARQQGVLVASTGYGFGDDARHRRHRGADRRLRRSGDIGRRDGPGGPGTRGERRDRPADRPGAGRGQGASTSPRSGTDAVRREVEHPVHDVRHAAVPARVRHARSSTPAGRARTA